jgi:hypothetical protein
LNNSKRNRKTNPRFVTSTSTDSIANGADTGTMKQIHIDEHFIFKKVASSTITGTQKRKSTIE